MLLGNITQIAQNCIRYSAYNGTTERSMLGTNSGNHLLRFSSLDKTSAIPNGYKIGSCWFPSIKEGGMSMIANGSTVVAFYSASAFMTGSGGLSISGVLFSTICALTGSTSFSASAQANGNVTIDFTGGNSVSFSLTGNGNVTIDFTGSSTWLAGMSLVQAMVCALSGSGELTGTALQLILMIASLTGDCTVSANITGQKSPTVSMTGGGGITANISAFGEMVSSLLGSGGLSAIPKALANMSVDIVVTGTGLNTANVGSAIWNAIASEFNNSGSMGELINNVGAGANPWTAPIDGTITAEEAMKILLSVLAGKTTITKGANNTAVVRFRDINDTRDGVTVNMTGSERKSISLDNG
jgi:hypothetical protein